MVRGLGGGVVRRLLGVVFGGFGVVSLARVRNISNVSGVVVRCVFDILHSTVRKQDVV